MEWSQSNADPRVVAMELAVDFFASQSGHLLPIEDDLLALAKKIYLFLMSSP